MKLYTPSELRKRLRRYHKKYNEVWQAYVAGDGTRLFKVPLFPDECRDMTCGAKTRKGTPCKRIDLYSNGRCRMHGGPSTGPITEEGKRRSALNGKLHKKKQTPWSANK